MAKKSNNPWSNKRRSQASTSEEWLDVLSGEENPGVQVPDDDDFEVDTSTSFPVLSTTTSTNSAKPRTLKAGYDFKEQKLIVVFRDGTWWEYRGVPDFMWYDFTAAESKGRFLRESGLDQWGDMGPADVTNMPKHRRVQMANTQEFANYMYLGNKE
jgi:hypothetical protein